MKTFFILMLILSLNYFTSNISASPIEISDDDSRATQVVPNSYSDTSGTGVFFGILQSSPRTYQLLIQASQLTNLVGTSLTALSVRNPVISVAYWPEADITFANYDIYLSRSVEPRVRSLTFVNNIAGPQTQVRSGTLDITANSYTGGGNPNVFGPDIIFDTPWFYGGGNLLIEIRHSGFTGSPKSSDAIQSSSPEYGTLVNACWTGSYTGTSGVQGNFTIIKLKNDIQFKLQLSCLIEGLYDAISNTMISDTAKIYLRNIFAPYSFADSAVSVLDVNGNGSFLFSNASNEINYYLVVDQRNSINTWSAAGNSFVNNILIYDFTSSSGSAYGNNLKSIVNGLNQGGGIWAIYSGDINKNGFVNSTDLLITETDASSFVTGYVVTDANGDLEVNLSDIILIYNNSTQKVKEIKP